MSERKAERLMAADLATISKQARKHLRRDMLDSDNHDASRWPWSEPAGDTEDWRQPLQIGGSIGSQSFILKRKTRAHHRSRGSRLPQLVAFRLRAFSDPTSNHVLPPVVDEWQLMVACARPILVGIQPSVQM